MRLQPRREVLRGMSDRSIDGGLLIQSPAQKILIRRDKSTEFRSEMIRHVEKQKLYVVSMYGSGTMMRVA